MAREFPHSFEVCTCRSVTLGEIVHCIKEKNAKTLEDVEKYTDAGSCCGSCKNAQSDIGAEKMQLYVEEILNKFNRS